MEISAVNFNKMNFRSHSYDDSTIDAEVLSAEDVPSVTTKPDKAEFSNKKTNQVTSPVTHFLTTSAWAVGSFVAAKKGVYASIKGLEGKFPLFNSLDTAGIALNKQLSKLKKSTIFEFYNMLR